MEKKRDKEKRNHAAHMRENEMTQKLKTEQENNEMLIKKINEVKTMLEV